MDFTITASWGDITVTATGTFAQLSGSDKQIVWAADIRDNLVRFANARAAETLSKMSRTVDAEKMQTEGQRLVDYLADRISKLDNAKQLIDGRTNLLGLLR